MAIESRSALRDRITRIAAGLLADGGPAAVTTRGVAEAAGVQAPTIYRLFGDKDGLLEAVAEFAMAAQVDEKARTAESEAAQGSDPVVDLRAAWRGQIAFGLENPSVFRLLSDPDRVRRSPAARAGRAVLDARIRRLAAAGLLRVPERRAADLVQAAAIGVIHDQLAREPDGRDPDLGDAMLDVLLARILHAEAADTLRDPHDVVVAAAAALRVAAPGLDALTPSERGLLQEWLDRVTGG